VHSTSGLGHHDLISVTRTKHERCPWPVAIKYVCKTADVKFEYSVGENVDGSTRKENVDNSARKGNQGLSIDIYFHNDAELFLPLPYCVDLSTLTDTPVMLYFYYFCVSH
jgi:hypothetical protein